MEKIIRLRSRGLNYKYINQNYNEYFFYTTAYLNKNYLK
jgi:hypothetical protein